MPLSMYQASVPVFTQALRRPVAACWTRPRPMPTAKKIDPAVLLARGWRPTCSRSAASSRSPATSPRAPLPASPASRCRAGPTTRRRSPSSRRASRRRRLCAGFKPAQIDGSEERESLKLVAGARSSQRPALSAALRAAELLLPRHDRLRHPAPQRRGARQARLHGPGAGNVMPGKSNEGRRSCFSLAGKAALVTGASSGFGRHFARVLAGPAPRWRWPRGALEVLERLAARDPGRRRRGRGGGHGRDRPRLGGEGRCGRRGGARADHHPGQQRRRPLRAPSSPRPPRRNGAR